MITIEVPLTYLFIGTLLFLFCASFIIGLFTGMSIQDKKPFHSQDQEESK